MNIPRDKVAALAEKMAFTGKIGLPVKADCVVRWSDELTNLLSENGGGGEAVAWPKWLHDRCIGALEKVEIQFAATGTRSAAVSETLMLARALRVSTTPPTPSAPAPAADPLATAGDDLAEQYRKGWEAGRADALGQPEARREEGMVLVPSHYADNVGYAAAVLEQSESVIDRNNAPPLRTLLRFLATPNPVRAEQPEGKGEDALIALFNEVYEREWDRAADEADDRAKAIMGPADEHATRMAIRAVLAAAHAAEVAERDARIAALEANAADRESEIEAIKAERARAEDQAEAASGQGVVPEPKVVPYGSASGEKDYAYGYEKGHADGWNACRNRMLDAIPPGAGQ